MAVLAATYVAGAVCLAALAIARVRTDGERMASVCARRNSARSEARARVIRIELEQAAGHGLWTR